MSITGDGTTNGGHMVPRHVWVAPDGRWADRCPGLAWERRQTEDGWEYLVTYVTGGGNVRPQTRGSWMPASLVRLVEEMKS